MTNKSYTDSSRSNWRGTGKKTINAIVWYPTEDTTTPETMIGQFVKVPVTAEGKVLMTNKKYPVIIFSHGAASTALQMIAWGHYLASRGYIVVSVNHKGDSTQEVQLGAFSLADRQMWHRPQDLTAVLNQFLLDPLFRPFIDKDKVAVGGFSLGGYTAIAIAGARLDLNQLRTKSELDALPAEIRKSIEVYGELLKKDTILQQSLQHSGDSFKDKRIKGVFALAPAIGEGFTKSGLSEINVPVQIVVGDEDVVAPKEKNAELYAKGIKGAKLTVLPHEVGHITKPDPVSDENWLKVFKMSYDFYQKLWSMKQ
ncbi:MAG: prolyl oligopeptidase family serine peptidase [Ferruginibacter sp.]